MIFLVLQQVFTVATITFPACKFRLVPELHEVHLIYSEDFEIFRRY